jgi:RNA polymerase sigma-70 factor, ECF subfamily
MTDRSADRTEFDRLVAALRPNLHRYCARMTGSVVDGEDVVQEAFLKAIEALSHTAPIANPEGWLFRIAHNAALDLLRRRKQREVVRDDDDLAAIAASVDPIGEREIAATGLRTFMRLPASQRSSVILRDVLGYTLEEIRDVIGGTVPAVKSALQRGRQRLRELAREPDHLPPPLLAEADRARLVTYVECFNARDFDAVRRMLADDVRLELVNRLSVRGREQVGEYFHRYALAEHWRFLAGFVDRRPAMLVFDRHDAAGRPAFFVLLDWRDGTLVAIRDFLFARYVLDGADLLTLEEHSE